MLSLCIATDHPVADVDEHRTRGVWLLLALLAGRTGTPRIDAVRARTILGVHSRDVRALAAAGLIERRRDGNGPYLVVVGADWSPWTPVSTVTAGGHDTVDTGVHGQRAHAPAIPLRGITCARAYARGTRGDHPPPLRRFR